MRIGEPVGEVVAALANHGEGFESTTNVGCARGRLQLAGERYHPRRDRRRGHRVQSVKQGRGGDLGRDPVADGRGQPCLGAAGLRSFRDHQQGHW